MELVRSLAIGLVIAAVLWLAFDSQLLTPDPPPSGTAYAVAALGLVFGIGGWVMHAGGQPERAPLLLGMALGLIGYAATRLLGF